MTGAAFRPWNECSTVPEFEPIALSSLTTPEDKGIQYWKSQHQAVNKVLPQVIASSLSKPLLYASVNAVDLVRDRAEEGKRRRNRGPDPLEGKSLSNDAEVLLGRLLAYHKCDSDSPCYAKIPNQRAMAAILNEDVTKENGIWTQTRLSHAIGELFPGGGMPRYKRLCDQELICRELLTLSLRSHAKGLRREFGLRDPDSFLDKGYEPVDGPPDADPEVT